MRANYGSHAPARSQDLAGSQARKEAGPINPGNTGAKLNLDGDMIMTTKQYAFEIRQDPNDGTWNFYDKDSSVPLAWGAGYTTREQAERAARQFADSMHQRDQIRREAREMAAPVIAEWFSGAAIRYTLERCSILECIKDGIEAALEDLRSEE
jgi:hypothetical protein